MDLYSYLVHVFAAGQSVRKAVSATVVYVGFRQVVPQKGPMLHCLLDLRHFKHTGEKWKGRPWAVT